MTWSSLFHYRQAQRSLGEVSERAAAERDGGHRAVLRLREEVAQEEEVKWRGKVSALEQVRGVSVAKRLRRRHIAEG